MSASSPTRFLHLRSKARHCLTGLLLLGSLNAAHAGLTDLWDAPFFNSTSSLLKPNIMLLMDTSNSMRFSHMPDEIEGNNSGYMPIGYKSYQCNTLYYNPNQSYLLPRDGSGNNLPTPDFNAARYNYYSTNESTINLERDFRAYDTATRQNQTVSDPAQPAYYYVHSVAGKKNYLASPCTDVDQGTSIAASDGGNWQRVIVSASSGPGGIDERQNFAIWYTYYRTRISLSKSAVSLAFVALNDSYRVGLITVKPDLSSDANYLPIADFDSAQRTAWYAKLFSQVPSGSSPSREALARVGRHYAGKQDGINAGMNGDPVQYSCQQNFTIMTTDGYWNTAAETKGPVQIDGVTLIGQQDGTLTDDAGWTPRPIWDGGTDTTRSTTDKFWEYRAAECTSPYAFRSSGGLLRSTSQNLESTSQITMSTSQLVQSTVRNLQSTLQNWANSTQNLQSTSQIWERTVQNLENTQQNKKRTVQLVQTSSQPLKTTRQTTESTYQTLESTSQVVKMTSVMLQRTIRTTMSTVQNLQSISQTVQDTVQNLESTTQILRSTVQNLQSSSRVDQRTSVIKRSTNQLLSYDATTELSTPVAECTSGGNITCKSLSTGPTVVSSCTSAEPSADNQYTKITCEQVTTGPDHVASCTAADASSANGYMTISCVPVNLPNVAVPSCTPQTANADNNWTTVTCSTANVSVEQAVNSCTPGTASASDPIPYLITTCQTKTLSSNAPVYSCTPETASASNNYVTRTCPTPITTTTVGVPSCTTASASSSNNWTTTTCTPSGISQTNVPVTSCTEQTASSSNAWTSITCSTANVKSEVLVASCIPGTAAASDAIPYLITMCNPISSAETPVSSCTEEPASSSNNYTTTRCRSDINSQVKTATCTEESPTASNNYVTTTCPAPIVTPSVPVASCTPQTGSTANNGLTRSCIPNDKPNSPVASCTKEEASASNNYVTRTCTGPTILSGPTVDPTCRPEDPSASNNFIETLCNLDSQSSGVTKCTPQDPTAANNWTTITCLPKDFTEPVASCTPQTASSANQWEEISCITNNNGNTAVESCTPETASSSNNWVTRTCPTPITTKTAVASCTPQTASANNQWITRSCEIETYPDQAVASCTPQAASADNQWMTTTCPPPVVKNQPQADDCVPQTASAANNWTTITCPAPVTNSQPVATCSPVEPTAENNYVRVTCSTDNISSNAVATCTDGIDATMTNITCKNVPLMPDTPVSSCTPVTASAENNFITVNCKDKTVTDTAVASCTPQTASSDNNWVTRTCPAPKTSKVGVESCTEQSPSASNDFITVTCSGMDPDPTEVANCTPVNASPENNWKATYCNFLPGHMLQRRLRTSQSTVSLSSGTIVGQTSPADTYDEWANVDGICYPDNSTLAQALGTIPANQRVTADQITPPGDCNAWPCTLETHTDQGSHNSLADVAQYYYVTDLRPDMVDDVRVKGSGPEEDRATHQHMTTFTLALGVSGTLNYSKDYMLDTVGDFARIRCNPLTGGCNNTCPSSDPSYPNCTPKRWPLWPDPSINYASDGSLYSDPRSIDDFWHTAVNGRGQYFNANETVAVVDGLQKALAGVKARLGAGSAASVSSVDLKEDNNFAYRSSFITEEWVGEVTAHTIDPATGLLSAIPRWSARSLLDSKVGVGCDRRKIYLFRSGATNNLTNFTFNTNTCNDSNLPDGSATTDLNADEQAYFGSSSITQLSQYSAMSDGSNGTVNQRTAAQGANLVNFLRGQHNLEGPTLFRSNDLTSLYRSRTHALGDIIGSQPAYVGAPGASYVDNGYSAFKLDNAKRSPTIYVGANDGMLHALNASSGQELWAYIPRLVLPRLYKLADNNYANTHQFYVDGTPSVADINTGTASESSWKTILVGGLNKGGKGYYAVDVTDPANPKGLWEFGWSTTCWDGHSTTASGDCHVGYSFGRPIITKLQDGRWVVIVASGLNNVNSPVLSGDGQGYLYILNATSGTLIAKIATGAGDSSTPSGLAHLTNFVDNGIVNNTSLRVYGGDLLGNIWRFDINDNLPPSGLEATRIGTATDSSGTAQPISARLELGEIEGKPWIYVGTGRLWGVSDVSNTQHQSLYGIRDPLSGSPVYPDLRGSLSLRTLTQVGSGSTAYRTNACATTCSSPNGWVIDLPDSGERVNLAPQLQLGTIVFLSNVPSPSVCLTGGYGWVNFMDYRTGGTVATSPDLASSRRFDTTIDVGGVITRQTDKTVIITVRGADSGGTGKDSSDSDRVNDPRYALPYVTPPPSGKRVSWREIIE